MREKEGTKRDGGETGERKKAKEGERKREERVERREGFIKLAWIERT